MEKTMENLTYGQKLVGLTFNPSGNSDVNDSKQSIANLIDLLNDIRSNTNDQEKSRYCSIAITELQTAQMWVVKALTA